MTSGDLNQREPEADPARAAAMGGGGGIAELAETDGGGDGGRGEGAGGMEGIGAEEPVREKSGGGEDAATGAASEYSREGAGGVRTADGAEAGG